MEKEERLILIRTFETECKNFYKIGCKESRGRYEIAKYLCYKLNVLSDQQIKELENHMKEQYQRDCKK